MDEMIYGEASYDGDVLTLIQGAITKEENEHTSCIVSVSSPTSSIVYNNNNNSNNKLPDDVRKCGYIRKWKVSFNSRDINICIFEMYL